MPKNQPGLSIFLSEKSSEYIRSCQKVCQKRQQSHNKSYGSMLFEYGCRGGDHSTFLFFETYSQVVQHSEHGQFLADPPWSTYFTQVLIFQFVFFLMFFFGRRVSDMYYIYMYVLYVMYTISSIGFSEEGSIPVVQRILSCIIKYHQYII